jgi:hypothetical protein
MVRKGRGPVEDCRRWYKKKSRSEIGCTFYCLPAKKEYVVTCLDITGRIITALKYLGGASINDLVCSSAKAVVHTHLACLELE